MSSLEKKAEKITESELEQLLFKAKNKTITEEEFIVFYYIRMRDDVQDKIIVTEKKIGRAHV